MCLTHDVMYHGRKKQECFATIVDLVVADISNSSWSVGAEHVNNTEHSPSTAD